MSESKVMESGYGIDEGRLDLKSKVKTTKIQNELLLILARD